MNTQDHGPPISGGGLTAGTALIIVYWLLRVITAAGLATDAYVHADLAPTYDAISRA